MTRPPRPALFAFLLTALLLLAPTARAQSSLAELQSLGERVQSIRLSIGDSPTLVIVPDERAFARAIGEWTLKVRHPVLIDDGTAEAREMIGRFVRAYEPETVVRWEGVEENPELGVRALYDDALARSWEATDREGLEKVWTDSGFTPLGAVVVSEGDPAWVAGLALAAGRGQLTIWSDGPRRGVGGMMPDEDLAKLDQEITGALEASGRSWNRIGDEIDALTLCLNRQSRYREAGEPMAVTDRIGRHGPGRRYAYTGMIFGEAPEAAYRAMCALFLQPESAWMFDGYDPSFAPPYAVANATRVAKTQAWQTIALTPPSNSARLWRRATRWGINADFVHVNTSGRFDRSTSGGAASTGTTSRRWTSRRSSTSSTPSPPSASTRRAPSRRAGSRTGRTSSSAPWTSPASTPSSPRRTCCAASSPPCPWAARRGTRCGPTVWKINYFGDPLMVVGPDAPRAEEGVPLDGATPMDDEMRAALKERNLAEAIGALVMLGRDADAVKLATAANQQTGDDETVDPELARAALDAVFRAGEADLFLDLCESLAKADALTARDIDRIWTAIRPDLNSTDRTDLVRALSENIRNASPVEDAGDLAPVVARLVSREAARAMIERVQSETNNPRDKQELDRLADRYRAPVSP